MATWWNIFSLSLTVAICVGAILAVICVVRQVSSSIQSTKESLKTRGISISKEGVSVKTDKRFDREHYIDATQRGIMKAMGASSFGKSPDSVERTESRGSSYSSSSSSSWKRAAGK
ncbi:hypothetical protein J3A83DRAFT_2932563 [Scleroderma citrinum]